MDPIDHMMMIMADAFDPHWGEAWTRRQLSDSMVLPTIFYRLIGTDGEPLPSGHECVPPDEFVPAGFTLSRHVCGEEELLLIAVRPDHRGRGLGRKLMECFEEDARKRGAAQLFLEMRINNPAEKLYRSCGFLPAGTRKNYYRLKDGTRLDAVTLSRQLQ
ncbi:GNAT family N-acetyltransferase [Allopontixanthobacter sp.]|uniref:GNAT family N-acetyltransferase n=1 Tax=Allopontixanthobacter sp. TaxID=2906452 RepID=UPI002ABA666F|nr:GNAT family N-acetyltransferase [Allopontixanthobacter sp.]MDZ4307913.1 GNAT family N-acetyltransferase [Allopontixanthobacter sp.]